MSSASVDHYRLPLGGGEMGNSTSVIAWLSRVGRDRRRVDRAAPMGPRPGWSAGVMVARRAHAPVFALAA